MKSKRVAAFAAAAVLGLGAGLAACGGDDETTTEIESVTEQAPSGGETAPLETLSTDSTSSTDTSTTTTDTTSTDTSGGTSTP